MRFHKPLLRILPPPIPKLFNRPDNHGSTDKSPDTQNREQPPISNRVDDGFGDQTAHAGENVAHEIVERDAVGGVLGHEFREHGCYDAEDEHCRPDWSDQSYP